MNEYKNDCYQNDIDLKPNVIFFARDYQALLFPKLLSEKYTSIYVTLTISEKKLIKKNGYEVGGCFEEEFDSLNVSTLPESYLKTSFVADRFFGAFSLDDRRLILSKEIAFWDGIFKKFRPVAVINELVAIEIAEVLYLEAFKNNIRYLAWVASPFENRNFYWADEPDHSRLDDRVFSGQPDNESLIFAKQYFQKINHDENSKPFYVSNLSSRYIPDKFFIPLAHLLINTIRSKIHLGTNLFLKAYYFDKVDLLNKIKNYLNSIFRAYDELTDGHDMVFYPLHYEPEASMLYMSEYHEDQIGLLRNLAKCLTNNQLLVVKEHPLQPGILLSKKFRQLKKQLSNVVFLPAEYPARKLIKLSKLTITQTSSAGWEAIVLGKPVVVFGKVFYDKHPGINIFSNFEDLRLMIHNNSYKYPKQESTINFIGHMWHYCEIGNPFPNPLLYEKESIEKIVAAIEKKLWEEGLIK